MEKSAIRKEREKPLTMQTWRENERSVRANYLIISFTFLILTMLAGGDLLEVIPWFSTLVAHPLFPFYHEAHDLLALIVVLYAAHKISPAIGFEAILWFLTLHIPYAYLVFPDVIGMRFPVPGDNPNTTVIQQRKPYILANAPDEHVVFHQEPHSHIHSWLGVPFIVGDRVIGMLAIDHTRPAYYTTDHARLVTAFANQVAIAIENARLFGRVEQLAITDGLTGLYNRRHFLELAGYEFQRARRYKRPLSVIMFDIDHFKKVNDTYNHAVGDQVLQVLASHCQGSLREIDVIARYDGEEFVVPPPGERYSCCRDCRRALASLRGTRSDQNGPRTCIRDD